VRSVSRLCCVLEHVSVGTPAACLPYREPDQVSIGNSAEFVTIAVQVKGYPTSFLLLIVRVYLHLYLVDVLNVLQFI